MASTATGRRLDGRPPPLGVASTGAPVLTALAPRERKWGNSREAPMPDHTRERDLVLAPNEFAFISDQTKGNINVYVGP
jgi:hypothetical protein